MSPPPYKILKVEDGLSFINLVKSTFINSPRVYNDFIDIMNEFRSQSIDTPGVIQRVSQLFKGHPEVIVGFNAFISPEYKIKVKANNQVSVCVPGSQTVIANLQVRGRCGPVSAVQSSPLAPSLSQQQHLSSTPTLSSINYRPIVQPVEFNHAVNFVIKIKNRFQEHPDIYKQFLEILHTFKKEQQKLEEEITSRLKPLIEEICRQVANLLQDQDLLKEFKEFFPDINVEP